MLCECATKIKKHSKGSDMLFGSCALITFREETTFHNIWQNVTIRDGNEILGNGNTIVIICHSKS